MKSLAIALIFFTATYSQAKIFCQGDELQVNEIIEKNVDVLDLLYNGNDFTDYKGNLCGVEDTDDLCFTGKDREAASELQAYFEYTYEYDDEINNFFVKFANGDFNSVDLYYKQQGSSYAFTIKRCD